MQCQQEWWKSICCHLHRKPRNINISFRVSEIVRHTCDQLVRGPDSIGVSALINLEPFTIGSREARTIPVTRSHECGNGTLVATRPLYRKTELNSSWSKRAGEGRTAVHLKVMPLPALTFIVLFVPTFPPLLQVRSVLEISSTGPSSRILRTTRVGMVCSYLRVSKVGLVGE